jgi:hypothetical protein
LGLLQLLAGNFAVAVTNGEVWLSIGLALLFGAGCWIFGTWVAQTVGLLRSGAPAGETLGVGLASGLIVLAAWWAAIWSGGRSSFTPVAVGFVVAIGLALVRRNRSPATLLIDPEAPEANGQTTAVWPLRSRRSLILTALGASVFIVAVALLYGSTMAPSPRDGVQPVEHNDEAFYAVLGRDLALTGTETNLSASGFSQLENVPAQTWYHWGELWLASAVITIFGSAPIAARYLVVLPIVLLAAAALTGTLVCRMTRTNSRRAYVFGFLSCLFLAPVPLIAGPFFSYWAVGMIFGITLYGLGAVTLLLALYGVAVLNQRSATWALAGFFGSTLAFLLPAHLAVVLLTLLGLGSVWAIRVIQSLRAVHRLPIPSRVWRQTLLASGGLLFTTLAWGLLTGHGLGGTGGVAPPPIVSPFNASWRDSVAITALGAGVFLAIPLAWLIGRNRALVQSDLYIGASVVLIGGAIAWGARLADFTMFYLFYAGIAVIATPVTAIAVRALWERFRATRHMILTTGLVVLCALQLGAGAFTGIVRLQVFGPHAVDPIPVSLLETIRRLPADAKLAYTCQPLSESGFGVPALLSIDAHTGRRVVPMCFEAEVLSTLIGAQPSLQVANLAFSWAPQRALYPDATADPSSSAVTAFMKDHGISFIYADSLHPNSLVHDAIPIATSGNAMVLRLP